MISVKSELPRPHRVLIIKPSALGDVVTALPVLRGLKRTFPETSVSWLVSKQWAPLIGHDSQLDEVVLFDRRRLGQAWRSAGAAGDLAQFLAHLAHGEYDWVIDLQGLLRSAIFAMATRAPLRAGFADAREGATVFYTRRDQPREQHTVDRNIHLARSLGLDARPADMSLELSQAGRDLAETLCGSCGLDRHEFVVCSAPTTWQTKVYPARHWRKVVARLAKDIPVVLIGSDGDNDLCNSIAEGLGAGVVNLAGRTTVDGMVAMIAASAGVICSDSAAKFVASAVGVDCVTLIGPTRPERTGPYLRGQAIVADVPCQGCLRKKCSHITCMQSIPPADVISAVQTMLRQHRT